MGELATRRAKTEARFAVLRKKLRSAEKIAAGKACVYATGSFGRCEASLHSDLDLFVAGKRNGSPGRNGIEGSLLKKLDDIRIKADLIEVTRELGIQEFSGDGEYLTHYSVHEFTKGLGTREDDVANTFTARVLLLLESRPLIEDAVYNDVIEEVIAAYWRDYADHKTNFMPAFLANDVLRLWRTFCVNYEARTKTAPEREKAKRRVKNYKLKHSRLLTCYSGLLFLLAVYKEFGTVTPSDALEMIRRTPTRRMEWLSRKPAFSRAHKTIAELKRQYEVFLKVTNVPEETLIDRFLDKSENQKLMKDAFRFGDLMYEVLKLTGGDTQFYRLMVV